MMGPYYGSRIGQAFGGTQDEEGWTFTRGSSLFSKRDPHAHSFLENSLKRMQDESLCENKVF